MHTLAHTLCDFLEFHLKNWHMVFILLLLSLFLPMGYNEKEPKFSIGQQQLKADCDAVAVQYKLSCLCKS